MQSRSPHGAPLSVTSGFEKDFAVQRVNVVKSQDLGILPPKTTVLPVSQRGFPDDLRPQEVSSTSEVLGETARQLPDAHRLYGYGERQIRYSSEVAAPQYNQGVVIVQDYMGLPQQPGHQMVHADEVIQNSAWQRCGAFLPIRDGSYGVPPASDWKRTDWSQAVDMRGIRQRAGQRGLQEKFDRLYRLRNA